jgi:flagellin-like hook-associated protein FlgL
VASKLNEDSDPVAVNNACLRLNAALEALEPVDDDSVTTVISGPLSVNPGAAFEVGIGINNVVQSVYAEDISLSYDADVFEYISADGVNDNIKILKEDKSTAGKVRLIAANIGGLSESDNEVLNITFKVKSGVENTIGSIAVTSAKLGVAPEGTVIEAGLSSRNIAVGSSIPTVDKSALIAAINSAQTLYNSAEAGTQPGQYPQEAIDALYTAINEAKDVRDDSGATQSQVNNAVTALNNAIDIFKNSVIKEVSADINNDGIIDVADLAIVAYHYGKTPESPDWDEAKIADMNGDNIINISDLAFVAAQIGD